MIRERQMVPAGDAAQTIADVVDTLREVEEALVKAGLWEFQAKLVAARGAVAGVGIDLRSASREVWSALRSGKDVPK